MEVVQGRCCGLDVHKKKVVACVITPEGKEIRGFSTMTEGLLGLAEWLFNHKVTHVAMESTGDTGRDRAGHGPIPQRCPLSLLGWGKSG